MALGTFSELKASVADWIARSDLTTQIPDFITLAEARINRKVRLRTFETDTTLTGTTSSRNLSLPSDYVEPIALFLTTSGDEELMTPFVAGTVEFQTYNGWPRRYTIDGTTIKLEKPCDQAHTFKFRYRQKLALSDSAPTNWLLTNAPDAYLAQTLSEAYAFIMDVQKAASWDAKATRALDEVNLLNARHKAMAPLQADAGLRATGSFNINSGDYS